MISVHAGRSLAVLSLLLATSGVAVAQRSGAGLTDSQIAHVAVAANAVDVEVAKLAIADTKNPAIRSFAQTMITDHTAVIGKAVSLAKKLGVTPADNAVSRSLWSGAKEAEAGLGKVKGAAFDRAYMDHEVAYHQAVIDALDGTLIPGASNAELKALLQTVRPVIAAHLDHAKSIRATLGNGR